MSYDSFPPLVSNGGSPDPHDRGGTEYRPEKHDSHQVGVASRTLLTDIDGMSHFDITFMYIGMDTGTSYWWSNS